MKLRRCGMLADMGMYTAWAFHGDLRKDTPPQIIGALECLTSLDCPEVSCVGPLFDHDFWRADRHRHVCLAMNAVYQPSRAPLLAHDPLDNKWSLYVMASLKNYGSEIQLFVDWLAPYIDTPYGRTFVGWKLYEEDEEPTLLYAFQGAIEWAEPTSKNEDSSL